MYQELQKMSYKMFSGKFGNIHEKYPLHLSSTQLLAPAAMAHCTLLNF